MRATLQTDAKTSSSAPPAFTPVGRDLLQRKCACGGSLGPSGECESCREKKLRRPGNSPDPSINDHSSSNSGLSSIVHDVLRSSGQPLDTRTRAFMEPRFGHDFSHVRVHADDTAAESARAVNALAYTVGKDVAFAERQYAPGTTAGQRLIAHELTHVVQQGQASRDVPLPTAGAIAHMGVNSSFEREADTVAERVISGSGAGMIGRTPTPAIQRQDAGVTNDAGPVAGGGTAGARTITAINVQMDNPQNVSLDWSDGSHTTGIECSTGQGHCCPRACDPPRNTVDGSNCTPDNGPFTVDNKYRRTGHLNYFVSFVPARQIGLHEYSPVNGTPLSHGCVRLHTADAATVYQGAVPGTTIVNVSGLAVPNCPRPGVPSCPGATGGSNTGAVTRESEEAVAQNLPEASTSETDPPMA